MALQAGRVGVNKNQVDWQGNIKGSGSSVQPQIDQIKSQIGTFEFSVVDGVAGYKKTGADTFTPFSTGGIGWNVPLDKLTLEGATLSSKITDIVGGYYIENDILYVDLSFTTNSVIPTNENIITINTTKTLPVSIMKLVLNKDTTISEFLSNNTDFGLISKEVNDLVVHPSDYQIASNSKCRLYGEIKLV